MLPDGHLSKKLENKINEQLEVEVADLTVPSTTIYSTAKASHESKTYMNISNSNKGKTIFVKGTTSAINFSQNEEIVYLPKKAIPKFAATLTKSKNDFLLLITGLIPKIGPAISIGSFVNTKYKESHAKQLKSLYKNGKNASHAIISSQYATLRSTAAWNGKTIKAKNYKASDRSGYKYTVKSVKYGKKL